MHWIQVQHQTEQSDYRSKQASSHTFTNSSTHHTLTHTLIQYAYEIVTLYIEI